MLNEAESRKIAADVLTAGRICIAMGICEAFGHISARLSDNKLFVITPKSSMGLIEDIEDLAVMDMTGTRVAGRREQPLETWLHTCIYRNRPDVGGIARTHSFTTSAFSVAGKSIKPVHDFGAILMGETPVFDDSRLIENEDIGTRLTEFIGPTGTAALLRGNGTAVLGKDVVEATVRAVYLEESAMLQYKAAGIGEPRYYTAEEIQARGGQLLESAHIVRAWEHYKMMAERNRFFV